MTPEVLYNMNAFVDGRGFAGVVKELMPPKIAPKLAEYVAGGLAAPIEVPMGMIEKMEAEMSVAAITADMFKLFQVLPNRDFAITFRGAVAVSGAGQKAVVIAMRGNVKSYDPGSWKAGEEAVSKYQLALTYFRYTLDGEDLIEADPINSVLVVAGVDQLAETRAMLGI